MQNIFIGYDSREKIASDVCEFSIKKRSSEKNKNKFIKKLKNLENKIFIKEMRIN